MAKREVLEPETFIVLYQTGPRQGDLISALVVPATDAGIREALCKARRGCRSVLIGFKNTLRPGDVRTLLNMCLDRMAANDYREISVS